MGVKNILRVFSWKPRKGINFGDQIGPMIVERLLARAGRAVEIAAAGTNDRKLLAVGSILHEARSGDHIWGSGVNGKSWPPDSIQNAALHFHSVRGPITRRAAIELGHDVPEKYGDPGILFPILFSDEIERKAAEILNDYDQAGLAFPTTAFIPNINDDRFYCPEKGDLDKTWLYVNPSSDPVVVAACIRLVDHVVSSSLHGIVFADVFGKDITFFQSRFEPMLKYDDYFMGTDREPVVPVSSLSMACRHANVGPFRFKPEELLASFPFHDGEQSAEDLILPVEILEVGERHRFATDERDGAPSPTIFTKGWTVPRNGSVWSVGKEVEILFATDPNLKQKLILRVDAGTLPTGKGHSEKLRISAGGKLLSTFEFKRGEPAKPIEIPLPPPDPLTGLVHLKGSIDHPSSLGHPGKGGDEPALGVWIGSYELRKAK
jgi:hypothetical protein